MAVTAVVSGITDDTGASATDQITNDNTITITVASAGASSVEVFLDGDSIGQATETSSGSGIWELDHSATPLDDGTYAITAEPTERVVLGGGFVTFVGGRVSDPLSLTIDTQPPGTPQKNGDEAAGNATFTDNNQQNPDSVSLPVGVGNGDAHITVFHSSSDNDIIGAIYENNVIVQEFKVSTNGVDPDFTPIVARLGTDKLIVIWETDDSSIDGSGSVLRAQRLDHSGNKIGGEFTVNQEAEASQSDPAVTTLNNGNVVVSWTTQDSNQDGDGTAVKAIVLDANGDAVVDEFLVNTSDEDDQEKPAVTALTGGGFVITWTDNLSEVLKAQIYDASGAQIGNEFDVGPDQDSEEPSIAALANGGFIVTFRTAGNGSAGDRFDVAGQIFDANGMAIAETFKINSQTAAGQFSPVVEVLKNGLIVVAWTTDDPNQDGDGTAIKAQILLPSGQKYGDEFLVNTNGTAFQEDPTIAAWENGKFVISWLTSDDTQDGNGYAIKSQVFEAPTPVTVDGISDDTGSNGTDGITNDDTLVIVGSAAGDARVEVLLNNVSIGIVIADEEGTWIFDHTGTPLPDGVHSVTARELDLAGNASASSDPLTVTIDTARPGEANKTGAEFLVNTSFTLGDQTGPNAATLTDGNIAVVYFSKEGQQNDIRVQRFTPDGVKIGDEISVFATDETGTSPFSPAITALDGGGFVVSEGFSKLGPVTIRSSIFEADGMLNVTEN